jgi:multidrug efflux pump
VVRHLIRRPVRSVLVYVLRYDGLALLFRHLPTAFLPEEDQGILYAMVQLPPGAPQERTLEVLKEVERHFEGNEKDLVDSVLTVAGFCFAGKGQNTGTAFLQLKDWSLRKGSGKSAQAIAQRASAALAHIRSGVAIALPRQRSSTSAMPLGSICSFRA